MQFILSDMFKEFPDLKFVIPHGGGAVPYHWGRYRGIAQDAKRPPLDVLMQNVWFDTCVYAYKGTETLVSEVGADNVIFASEMIGAVRSVDPKSGHHFDDTKRYIDALNLPEADRYKIFEGNALKVYPRLAETLAKRKAAV
jgi:4-oxalmesaconate hydratase